jgi:hypothetical protein
MELTPRAKELRSQCALLIKELTKINPKHRILGYTAKGKDKAEQARMFKELSDNFMPPSAKDCTLAEANEQMYQSFWYALTAALAIERISHGLIGPKDNQAKGPD